ncbi:MAG: pilus assembly protein [Rhizobiales bacterium]|nr:pilus assembly protein [Hyphomicrobiales bacterium]
MLGFWRDEHGGVAVAFALASIPLIGIAGMAIDYMRASEVRSALQVEADAAALASAASKDASASTAWVTNLKSTIGDRFSGGAAIENLAADGEWVSTSDFRVQASADVPLTFLRIVPGIEDHFAIEVESVARVTKPKLTYKPPKFTDLDPEASDYNRLSVYCFDIEKKNDPLTKGRSQETTIADNAGTKYNYTLPTCKAGETMSYHLKNVRDARTKPKQWDNPKATQYHYYTDTVMSGGVETYDLGGYAILETVLCDTAAKCVGQSQGGVIPEGANRTPQHATQSCQSGKFMYYGWEDRPPGLGWTDRDYNDIRVVIECPVSESTGEFLVRLIK